MHVSLKLLYGGEDGTYAYSEDLCDNTVAQLIIARVYVYVCVCIEAVMGRRTIKTMDTGSRRG